MITTAEGLFREIDRMPFGVRQRVLADTARALRGSGRLDTLLSELDGRGEFGQRIAVYLASVAGHHTYLRAVLRSPHTSVVSAALNAGVRSGLPGAAFAERLPELPTALRRWLYRSVRRHRATELAEALLPGARERYGDREAAALLPACSSSTVDRLLPELEHAVANWSVLGHRHPGVLLDYLDTQLAATPRAAWAPLWQRIGPGVAAAGRAEPEKVLALLEKSVAYVTLPAGLSDTIGVLARHDPGRLLGILLNPRRSGPLPDRRSLWRAVVGAGDAELIGLARVLAPNPPMLVRFLHALPPSRRAPIYSGAVRERDLVSAGIPLTALDELPAEDRAAEARRLLKLRSVADDPVRRLEVTARLPWEESRPVLAEATRRATAEERRQAYPLYVLAAAATRDRVILGEVLGTLNRLANEQDPVRAQALQALAGVPPWLFQVDDAGVLAALMTDAAQARDSSWMTHTAIQDLAGGLIREGAVSGRGPLIETGLRGLEKLGEHLPDVQLSALDRMLPRGGEHGVFQALRPRIEADARRGRYGVALALTAGLRRRAWAMPELQAYVDKARKAKDDDTVRRAIELWLAPPATRDERVAAVLKADRSTITVPAVQAAVGWRCTDLLDDVFARPMHGRFLVRGLRYIPPFGPYLGRWLPRQVDAYARLLSSLATAPDAPTYERAAAVRDLGRVPGSAAVLQRFLADPETQVVDAALGALAWTDEPGAVLPGLLGWADTDRAHIAVYAACRCARFVLPAQLGAALRPVLAGRKITARKEAARLLAEHHVPDAPAALAEAWSAPDQHRDVRRALVSAARWFLDDERAWELLGRAAVDEQAVAAAVLDLPPYSIAERHRPRYARLVRTVAAASDPDTAILGLATLPTWSRWDADGAGLLVDLVADLTNTATWRAALNALVVVCDVTENPEPLRAIATRLLAAEDSLDPAPDRDQPARQRLGALSSRVQESSDQSPVLRAAAADLVGLLTAPALRANAVELAIAAIPWEDEGGDLDALRRVALLADSPVIGLHARWRLGVAMSHYVRLLSQARMLVVAQALAADEPPAPALALAIAVHAGPEAGWPQPWRTLVGTLRRHPDPDVHLVALDIYVAPE